LSQMEGPLPTAVQNARLVHVLENLKDFESRLAAGDPPEVLAEHNRIVIQKLESVTGVVDSEDVLDRIFSDFCIGK
jgi:tRNA modification GTPase